MNRWWLMLIVCVVWLGVCGCNIINMPPTPGTRTAELFTEELSHYQVVSLDDVVIGSVDGMIVNVESTEAHYLVVRIEDIYDFGKGSSGPQDRFMLIPWANVQVDRTHQQLIVDVKASVLYEAPAGYELPDTTIPLWDAEIRQFWVSY